MKINVKNEINHLRVVVLGIADSFGGTPKLENAYDPKSKEHIKQGTFPKEEDLKREIEAFNDVFKKYNVTVYRPHNIENYNQIFSRDIAFVIENKFFIPNILPDRAKEIEAIHNLVAQIPTENIVKIPKGANIEGGDVMPWNDYIFIGMSFQKDYKEYITARTNENAVDFIKSQFPNKIVKAFELNKSNIEPRDNALHLDCCFQPLGQGKAIIYKGGFKNEEDYNFLIDFFGKQNCFEITRQEMYDMNSNVFSISQKIVVSEKNFTRLNSKLEEWGFTVEKIPYAETAKMEGLLRCSTMPLLRE